MPINKLLIILDRPRKIYHQGEHIAGILVIENRYELKHEGIQLSIEGSIDIHFNLRTMSLMDTFYKSNKSVEILSDSVELVREGRLIPGRTEIPFHILLDASKEHQTGLYETYRGVFIAIQYCVKCVIKRSLLLKDLVEFTEFLVEYDANPIGAPLLVKNPIQFEITPDSVTSFRRDIIPNFKIVGKLDSAIWRLTEPLTGEFTIEYCDSIIRSADLQLVRVEGSGLSPNDRDYNRESTEVQNIQIGDGDLLRNTTIPIYMIFPKLFTCPTLITGKFRIGEFEKYLMI